MKKAGISASLFQRFKKSLFPAALLAVLRAFLQARLVGAFQHLDGQLLAALGALTPILGSLHDLGVVFGSTARTRGHVSVAGQLLGPVDCSGAVGSLNLEGLGVGDRAGDFDGVLAHGSAFRWRCR